MELARATPALRDIAVGPVRRNGETREGAFPASAEALANSTPRVAFARPYSVDFTGWLDDFSHSGIYDALGGIARIGTHVNAFTFKSGVISPIAPGAARAVVQGARGARAEQPLPRLGRARPRRRLHALPARPRLQLRPGAGAARRMRRLLAILARDGRDRGAVPAWRRAAARATARRYTIELDNAFGLVEGGDVRVAGVNAGSVIAIELDPRTKKALVEVELTETGFGSLRSDVFCESRPQSPIGEYYVDCLPGTAAEEIAPGSRVPVEQTASTIPPDLIQNVMRLPYRERFRLIVNELGAGLAGRPEHLNATIRRAVPALRQTARVLEILAEHDTVIRDLVTDADRVVGKLADNRRDVGRFVVEARDTSAASAERAGDIRLNFNRLPHFLEELTPTMAALGEAAEEQRPVLVDLGESAEQLRRFFVNTADFATASRPAIKAFGQAAEVGRPALRAAKPRIRELREYSRPTPDLARNLRIVLEDFDDPARAVEADPRSPTGKGYSGTQAILRYIFGQSLVLNAFDELGYMVRSASHVSHCASYADAAEAQKPEKENCRAWLGPNQPGVTTPDPSAAPAAATARARQRRPGARHAPAGRPPSRAPAPAAPGAPGRPPGGAPVVPDVVGDLLDGLDLTPALPRHGPRLPSDGAPLLDFLLAP